MCLLFNQACLNEKLLANTHTHTHIYIYIYICMHTHTHTHTHIYIYTHIYICIHMLHSHSQLYTCTCGNIVNTIMTNETQFFRKIYLWLYSKGLWKGYVWEVSWILKKDCNILTPSSSGYSSTPFSSCEAAQARALNSKLQTIWTSCRTGLDHCLTSTCFLWASHLHQIQPVHNQGYTLISSTGCTCSLIDGWVNMLHI